MKPEEVIDLLKIQREDCSASVLREDDIDYAIQALEKQIPIKPRYYIDNWEHNRPGCPECPENEILYAGQKYCSVCGTKIDWSEE